MQANPQNKAVLVLAKLVLQIFFQAALSRTFYLKKVLCDGVVTVKSLKLSVVHFHVLITWKDRLFQQEFLSTGVSSILWACLKGIAGATQNLIKPQILCPQSVSDYRAFSCLHYEGRVVLSNPIISQELIANPIIPVMPNPCLLPMTCWLQYYLLINVFPSLEHGHS